MLSSLAVHYVGFLKLKKLQAPMDASRTPDVKPRITDESEKVKTWKLADNVDNGHLRALHLSDTDTNPSKVC